MATKRPGKENITPGMHPVNKAQTAAPDAPSPQKLADKAKELKSKPRKPKKGLTQSKEELTKEIAVAEHFKLAEDMARDTVDILDIGMSHVDDMYDYEIQWVLKKRLEKVSFKFNKTEGQTVGNACFSLYKKVDPARLAAWGGFMTAAALVATVLLPRMKLAQELSQLRKDLEDELKRQKEATTRGTAPAVSSSRVPSKPAPAPAVAGVPVAGPDGKIHNVNPTPDSAPDK